MIHIWLPSPQAPLQVWQPTTQTWQTADNWQEVATLISLQLSAKSAKKNTAISKQVCLYFPSIHLLSIQPNLPANQIKALGEAGRRYLFEDISISSVEDLQVKLSSDNMPSLYALHSSDREQWENAMSLVGLELAALLPDFLLLPNQVLPKNVPISSDDLQNSSQQAAVFYQDNSTQLMAFTQANTPMVTGMAVTHLPLILATMPQLAILYLAQPAFVDETNNPLNLQQWLQDFPNLNITTTDLSPRPVAEPIREFFNFAIKTTESRVPAYAKIIGMVLVLAALMGIIVDGLRWYYYQKAVGQTKAAIAMQYNQWFPNEKFNPQLTIQRQLQGKLLDTQGAENKIVTTLSSIQPIFQQHQIVANNLNYQGQILQMNVTANNVEMLNKAVTQLNAQGINTKLGSVSGNANAMTAPAVATSPVTTSSPAGLNNPLSNINKPNINSSNALIQITL